ncbi:M1 family metallopeptidase [Sphingomonas astaxanthinifaciens]|uniref:Aminopeptidase N n=1 Tax=Sphingomonas astaxanthinifaciens DSM 22298 TaxID=1123267 RepID=A0ABQ5Z8S7_9SPHN|nr:M1 family metallopeptidase [Sphingomonas astaxanthinifaciens]GLR47921.1 aminopeptidase [Sphingomonas astaxanthinifaciens DSM 22298]
MTRTALLLASALAMTVPAMASAQPHAAPAVAPVLATADAVDPHSFARPREARVTHVALDLNVDFARRSVAGSATLDVQRRPGARALVLDSKGYRVTKVNDAETGRPLAFAFGQGTPELGRPLTIQLGPRTRKVRIAYVARDAEALQWLTPAQTAGKKAPFLFSQGQSILNRSWIPTQDSPGIRQSWSATIRVPAPLTAVMSAPGGGVRTAPSPATSANGTRTFRFAMDKPVAPYLIAIAVGDLKFQPLGPRTGVWAEPATLPAAARELEDTEKMVTAAERLFGPYRWGRYDMIVLPPSFPFGGMENPTLTFLTPTFIAGDKSLVSLIAHELAHSWSGNLATNATWADFWLNEGTTTYAERRIVEQLYGPKVARQQVALGIDALDAAVTDNGGPQGPDTRLHIDLKGRHPDDGLTHIAYEKGSAFLRMLEANLGRARFDTFLRGWFDRHAFKPVTSAMFLADLRRELVRGDARLERRLELDRWVYGTGIPDNAVPADPSAFAEVDGAVATFTATGTLPAAWSRWTTDERLRFLNKLPRQQARPRLDALERAWRLDETGNQEVLFAWLTLAVANRYDPAVPALERFLEGQGRRKFVRPLFKTLMDDRAWGRPIALRIYPRARPLYHPLVTQELDKLVVR